MESPQCTARGPTQFEEKKSQIWLPTNPGVIREWLRDFFGFSWLRLWGKFRELLRERFGISRVVPRMLGQKSCRTKVSRIFRFFVPDFAPNFAPNFPRIFRGFFVLRFVGNGDQKKFTKNPRHFSMQNSQANSKKKSTKILESGQSKRMAFPFWEPFFRNWGGPQASDLETWHPCKQGSFLKVRTLWNWLVGPKNQLETGMGGLKRTERRGGGDSPRKLPLETLDFRFQIGGFLLNLCSESVERAQFQGAAENLKFSPPLPSGAPGFHRLLIILELISVLDALTLTL